MTRRMFWLCLVFLLSGPMVCWAAAQMTPKLIVRPVAGHGGDLFFLSGGGFMPHTKLTFLIGCPNSKPGGRDHFLMGKPGPVTDNHGQFVAFPMSAVALPVRTSRPCHIYASQGGQPYGPANPPLYTLYSDNKTLPACVTQICLKVTQRLQHHGSAMMDAVTIAGWPGMAMRASVSDSHGVVIGVPLVATLPWNGKVVWRLPTTIVCDQSASKFTLRIDGHLAATSASYTAPFTPSCG